MCMDILFPIDNESSLKESIEAKGVSEVIFAYPDLKKETVILDDKIIKKVGLKNILCKKNYFIIYNAKYSSEYLIPLLKKKLVSVVFGLEWHSRKDTLRKIDSGITPEIIALLDDVLYGFCATDILEVVNIKPTIFIPRLAQNARLLKNTILFSGRRVFSAGEKQAIKSIFFK